MKKIPPTISCFQETIKTTNKISEGMLCMSNASAVCQKVSSGENTSKENNDKNKIKTIDKILGVQ